MVAECKPTGHWERLLKEWKSPIKEIGSEKPAVHWQIFLSKKLTLR